MAGNAKRGNNRRSHQIDPVRLPDTLLVLVDVVVEFGEAGGNLALALFAQSLKFALRERQLLDSFDEGVEMLGAKEAQIAII